MAGHVAEWWSKSSWVTGASWVSGEVSAEASSGGDGAGDHPQMPPVAVGMALLRGHVPLHAPPYPPYQSPMEVMYYSYYFPGLSSTDFSAKG